MSLAIWKHPCAKRNQQPISPHDLSTTALSALARVKLVYQRKQGKGKSSDTSHFPASFKMAKAGVSVGDLKLQLWTWWVAFPQRHLSGLVAVQQAVQWMER